MVDPLLAPPVPPFAALRRGARTGSRRPASLARRAILASLAAVVLGSLGACIGSTGNEKFAFEARIGGVERDASKPFAFTNQFGWTVTLSEATAVVGPLYLNTLVPRSTASRGPRWPSWLVREAWADDTSSGDGLIVGEVLAQQTVNLLSPELTPFRLPGSITSDPVRSAQIFYYPRPDTSPDAMEPRVNALEIRGTAFKGADSLAFHGSLVLNADWLTKAAPGSRDATTITASRQVNRVPASFVASEGGHLEVRIDVASMLDRAKFDQLLGDDPPQPRDPADPSVYLLKQGDNADQVMKTLHEGLFATSSTYAVRWVPAE